MTARPDASERAATIRAAERWFEQQGLPYFVPANAERVRSALSKSRMIPVTVVALPVGAGAGLTTGAAVTDLSRGILGERSCSPWCSGSTDMSVALSDRCWPAAANSPLWGA